MIAHNLSMPSPSLTCPNCGKVCHIDDRFCSACGIALKPGLIPGALPPEATAADTLLYLETLPPGMTLGQKGRYQVVSTLGKGGFAQAYLAHDTHLDRYCVIKRLVLKSNWSERVQRLALQNFQREAQLLVTLNSPGHPNIPEIYEYLAESRCLIMKYIEGRDLDQILLERGGFLPEKEALMYIRDVCSAMVYMHSRQPEAVLHRDIKPPNILIDSRGRVWVVDFGLSKAVPLQVDTVDPKDTQIAGTLGYSPAEQWRHKATPRSDVYALAATMHTMLTGYRPNFTRTDLPDILKGKKGTFPPIRTLKSELNPEVEELIQRAMTFDMSTRPTAQEFLDALDTILAPVAARPAIQTPDGTDVSNEQELMTWCEQHWTQAALWLYDKDSLPGQIERIWGQNRLASELRAVVQANTRDQDAGLDATLALLDPDGFGQEKPRLKSDKASLDYGWMSADGQHERVLILTNVGRRYIRATLRLPNWLTTNTPVVALLPGQRLTTTLMVNMRRIKKGGRVRDVVLIHDEGGILRRIRVQVRLSSIRTFWTWITGGPGTEVWRLVDTLTGHGGAVWTVAFSPDRHLLASGGEDSTIRLWRVSDGKLLQTLSGHRDTVMSLVFHPLGQLLLSSGADGTMKVWRVNDGALLQSLIGHSVTVWNIALRVDAQMLASGSGDATIKLWRMEDTIPLRTLSGHKGSVLSVAFSPDGHILASGSGDNTIRFWRTGDGTVLQQLGGHPLSVWSVAFSPDGQTLVSGGGDGAVKLWRVSDGTLLQTLSGPSRLVYSVAFNPNGHIVAAGDREGKVTLWQHQEARPLQVLEGHRDGVQRVVFSADEQMLAAASLDGTITLWQVGYE